MGRRELRLIASPHHDGLAGVDRGRGPERLLEAGGLPDALARPGRPASLRVAGPADAGAPEAARVFAVARAIAGHVRDAVAEAAFPLVLAGDCNSCLGTVAGVGTDGLGIVWLDAHADLDTPEDSRSGSLDAMGLALLTGRGWPALRATVPGLAPVRERDVVLAAVRDLEPHQRERLGSSGIAALPAGAYSAAGLAAALDDLRGRVGRVYLHVDLDALDPAEGIANRYAAPGGLSAGQVLDALAAVGDRFEVAAAAVTAYEPDADADGRMAATAGRIIAALADLGTA
jgi:arginase